MLAANEALERFFNELRGDLASRAMQADDLRPAGEQFRRAAFINRDMGFGMTQNGAKWRGDCRKD